MLIVDEFQEFFVEDDKVAQESRCCSTGWFGKAARSASTRKLGSQTLGGASRWPAARWDRWRCDRLSVQRVRRPLDPERRELGREAALASRRGHLQRRQRHARREPLLPGRLAVGQAEGSLFTAAYELDRERNPGCPPPDRFRRELPADLIRNITPRQVDRGGPRPASGQSPFGMAGGRGGDQDSNGRRVSPASGAHLLLVGQNDELARGVVTAAVTSLGAQYPLKEISLRFWMAPSRFARRRAIRPARAKLAPGD